ncbi:unnamed protein product [Meganyctiphanes norvegica]|uniref:CUB domain-containing protein n=1 Tax=Meganyctiphanes norvegica TaxID=48144 RepID=A0AAV2PT87_MEGNR
MNVKSSSVMAKVCFLVAALGGTHGCNPGGFIRPPVRPPVRPPGGGPGGGTGGSNLATLPCGPSTMSAGSRVVVQSPNFPRNYPNFNRNQWELTCLPRASTSLSFNCPVFELEDSAGCTADRLIVASKGAREQLCGGNSPDGTVTADGWARLTFAANARTNGRGFRCFIWCNDNSTTTAPSSSSTSSTASALTDVSSSTAQPSQSANPETQPATEADSTTAPVPTTTAANTT